MPTIYKNSKKISRTAKLYHLYYNVNYFQKLINNPEHILHNGIVEIMLYFESTKTSEVHIRSLKNNA